MSAPHFEIDLEAILVPQSLDGSAPGDAVSQEGISPWSITDSERGVTWCGLFMSHGWVRRPWRESPEHRRGKVCISRVEYVVRDPID